MDNSLSEKLEDLLKKGKITEEEKAELERAIYGSPQENRYKTQYKQIESVEVQQFLHTDIEINGGEAFAVIKGEENLQLEQKGNIILITPKSKGIGVLGSFLRAVKEGDRIVLTVPKNTRLKVKTVSSDIEINGVQGNLHISTVSGDIEIAGAVQKENKSRIEVSTISGDIKLSKINAELDAKVKSGDFFIWGAKVSGTIKLYSGDIEVLDTEFTDSISIKTFSGDIELKRASIKGSAKIETFYGDIDITVKNSDVSVCAESKNGTVSIDSALKSGKGYPLNVRTKKGDISIKQNGGAL